MLTFLCFKRILLLGGDTMSNLGNREVFSANLTRLMSEKGIDRTQLCNDLNFKYSTVSEWITAKKYPRIDKIEIMAKYFGVGKSDLIEIKQKEKNPMSDDDIRLSKLFNDIKNLSPQQQQALKVLVDSYKNE